MKWYGIAAATLALSLLTFSQFPGHTWLQQDSQIYVPVLENQYDHSVLRNDMLVEQSHLAFTLYDETALAIRRATGLNYREVLAGQQIVARALGIWGLFLIAQAFGLSAAPATVVALIVSLGAAIPGPAVLTTEYEPTPRAIALPLLYCAIGLAARARYMPAAILGAVALLYHFPAALPFWLLFAAILWQRRNWRRYYLALAPLAAAALLLALAAQPQSGAAGLFTRITPMQEQLQRMRTAYVWISTWPAQTIWHLLIVFAIAIAAGLRVRCKMPLELRVFLPGLAVIGLLSVPLSWILLEHSKLALAPQLQPLRWLLYLTLAMQLLAATAAGLAVRWWEAALWLAMAFLPAVQPVFTGSYQWRGIGVAIALAAATALAKRFAPAVALASFLLIPILGGIRNYPHLHTPELARLSQWARESTPRDAVFLFPDSGRALEPGIFRSEALRAVYVDWKAGGQVNYLPDFAEQWWFRWQQTVGRGFKPEDLPRYESLGIRYIVLQKANRLPRPPDFENEKYVVYRSLPVAAR